MYIILSEKCRTEEYNWHSIETLESHFTVLFGNVLIVNIILYYAQPISIQFIGSL